MTSRGKDVLFIIGDWNAKVGSPEIPGITGKFGLGVQNEAGQKLTEFCQDKKLVKQEMARVNIDILGIGKLKWTGMGGFNSDDLLLWTRLP